MELLDDENNFSKRASSSSIFSMDLEREEAR